MDNEEQYKAILEKLETLPSSWQVESLYEKLDEVSDHLYALRVFGMYDSTSSRILYELRHNRK